MILLLLISVVIGLVLLSKSRSKQVMHNRNDIIEPPTAPATIPYVSHIYGLLRHQFGYYDKLCHQIQQPVFTIHLPGTKIYVVNTVELIQAIQKQSDNFRFHGIAAELAARICGASKNAQAILVKNIDGSDGSFGLSMDTYDAIHSSLTSGPALDGMSVKVVEEITTLLDVLVPLGQGYVELNLGDWVRTMITSVTTNAIYGPKNPLRRAELQQNFWEFEHHLASIVLGVVPPFMKRGVAAREKLVNSFEDYLRTGGHGTGSILVQELFDIFNKHGVGVRDIARFEVGSVLTTLVNTVPAAFWLIRYVFTTPDLVDKLRLELDSIVQISSGSNGRNTHYIGLDAVKSSCPLLMSTYQESLRLSSMGTSVRKVAQDTILGGTWLLRRGNLVQMTSCMIRKDPDIWGSDATEFVPQRFTKDHKPKTANHRRQNPAAFRTFGGGATLCPGRHFATNEILALTTMLILRFDIKVPDNREVRPLDGNVDSECILEVSHRTGLEIGEWRFDYGP